MKIEHNGFEIEYHDFNDTWHCRDLEMKAERLGKLKEKINKHCADLRRLPVIKAIELSTWGERVTRCDITGRMMDDPKSVWTVRREKNTMTRRKASLESLALDTLDNRALIRTAIEADKMQEAATKAARAAWEAIPRLNAPDALDTAAKLILEAQDKIAAEPAEATT